MLDAPSEGSAERRNRAAERETFSAFCGRLFRLIAKDRRSWIACLRVDSTSSQARRFVERSARAGVSPSPACFVAWEQTSGRGRAARRWSSAPGLGLYLTFLLPDVAPETVRRLPMAFAILVARAVEGAGAPARIKWPNDIVSGGGKLAGILLETASRGANPAGGGGGVVLAGIGINVHHGRGELPVPGATSLALEGAEDVDMANLAFEVATSVNEFLAEPPAMTDTMRDYRSLSVHVAGDKLRCRRGDGFVEGVFSGFDDDGSLLLDEGGRVTRFTSSEIVET